MLVHTALRLSTLSNKGLRRQQHHHPGMDAGDDQTNNVQVAYSREPASPTSTFGAMLNVGGDDVLPNIGSALDPTPGPEKAEATIIWPVTEYMVASKDVGRSSSGDDLRLLMQFEITKPTKTVGVVSPPAVLAVPIAARADSSNYMDGVGVVGSTAARRVAALLESNAEGTHECNPIHTSTSIWFKWRRLISHRYSPRLDVISALHPAASAICADVSAPARCTCCHCAVSIGTAPSDWWCSVCKFLEKGGAAAAPATTTEDHTTPRADCIDEPFKAGTPVMPPSQEGQLSLLSLSSYRNVQRQTLLHLAVQTDSPKITALLLSDLLAPLPPDTQDVHGNTALHIAVGSVGVGGRNGADWIVAWHVRTLLKHGADPSIINDRGATAAGLVDGKTSPKTLAAFSNPAAAVAAAAASSGGHASFLSEASGKAKASKDKSKYSAAVASSASAVLGEGASVGVASGPVRGLSASKGYEQLNTAFASAADASVAANAAIDLSSLIRDYMAFSREINGVPQAV